MKSKAVFDAAWVSLRTTDNFHYSGYINFMNVDLLVTCVMWLLVATTEIHFKTCFCAVFQDL